MSEIAIKVENVSKIYKLYDKPIERMKESLHPFRKVYHKDFYALKDVSFEIKKGETIGIIGKNGSGKSTLLKILTGVLSPSSGAVGVNGKVSALLELGAGFNPEFTGVENVYFNGSIMGYNREQMNSKIDDILSFADIGDFVYQPVKTYSSGMFVRLAFALATSVNPEILIVDEALSVGDIFFQSKCMNRMQEMIDNNVSLIFCSHDLLSIKRITKKALWLHQGSLCGYGDSNAVCEKYYSFMAQTENKQQAAAAASVPNEISSELTWGEYKKRMGTGEVRIDKIELNGIELKWDDIIKLDTFDNMNFRVSFHKENPEVKGISLSVVFFDSKGVYCSGFSTRYDDYKIDMNEGVVSCSVNKISFLRGLYSLSISVWDEMISVPYDLHERMYDVMVSSPRLKDEGLFYIPHIWGEGD
jgi:ABC-type polysaccharide/polyol phosphate transport system ATPase subunit